MHGSPSVADELLSSVAERNVLLARSLGVISNLQVDVAGLLYELDEQQGRAVAAAASAGVSPTSITGSAPQVATTAPAAGVEDLHKAVLQRNSLLHRVVDSIQRLTVDAHGLLWEIDAAQHSRGSEPYFSPVPFPTLSPEAALPPASPASHPNGSDSPEATQGPASRAIIPPGSTEEMFLGGAAGADFAFPTSSGTPQPSAAVTLGLGAAGGRAELSPHTAAFVNRAHAVREALAAQNAVALEACGPTCGKAAGAEAERMLTVRRQLVQELQAVGRVGRSSPPRPANLGAMFEVAAASGQPRAPLPTSPPPGPAAAPTATSIDAASSSLASLVAVPHEQLVAQLSLIRASASIQEAGEQHLQQQRQQEEEHRTATGSMAATPVAASLAVSHRASQAAEASSAATALHAAGRSVQPAAGSASALELEQQPLQPNTTGAGGEASAARPAPILPTIVHPAHTSALEHMLAGLAAPNSAGPAGQPHPSLGKGGLAAGPALSPAVSRATSPPVRRASLQHGAAFAGTPSNAFMASGGSGMEGPSESFVLRMVRAAKGSTPIVAPVDDMPTALAGPVLTATAPTVAPSTATGTNANQSMEGEAAGWEEHAQAIMARIQSGKQAPPSVAAPAPTPAPAVQLPAEAAVQLPAEAAVQLPAEAAVQLPAEQASSALGAGGLHAGLPAPAVQLPVEAAAAPPAPAPAVLLPAEQSRSALGAGGLHAGLPASEVQPVEAQAPAPAPAVQLPAEQPRKALGADGLLAWIPALAVQLSAEVAVLDPAEQPCSALGADGPHVGPTSSPTEATAPAIPAALQPPREEAEEGASVSPSPAPAAVAFSPGGIEAMLLLVAAQLSEPEEVLRLREEQVVQPGSMQGSSGGPSLCGQEQGALHSPGAGTSLGIAALLQQLQAHTEGAHGGRAVEAEPAPVLEGACQPPPPAGSHGARGSEAAAVDAILQELSDRLPPTVAAAAPPAAATLLLGSQAPAYTSAAVATAAAGSQGIDAIMAELESRLSSINDEYQQRSQQEEVPSPGSRAAFAPSTAGPAAGVRDVLGGASEPLLAAAAGSSLSPGQGAVQQHVAAGGPVVQASLASQPARPMHEGSPALKPHLGIAAAPSPTPAAAVGVAEARLAELREHRGQEEPAASGLADHAAEVAQQLLQQVLAAQQAESAAAQAEADCARAAAQQVEAQVRGLEAEGRWLEAASAALEADRLHAVARAGQLAASAVTQQQDELRRELEALAAEGPTATQASAIRAPTDHSGPDSGTAKGSHAVRLLQVALEWAQPASTASTPGPVGSQGLPVPPASAGIGSSAVGQAMGSGVPASPGDSTAAGSPARSAVQALEVKATQLLAHLNAAAGGQSPSRNVTDSRAASAQRPAGSSEGRGSVAGTAPVILPQQAEAEHSGSMASTLPPSMPETREGSSLQHSPQAPPSSAKPHPSSPVASLKGATAPPSSPPQHASTLPGLGGQDTSRALPAAAAATAEAGAATPQVGLRGRRDGLLPSCTEAVQQIAALEASDSSPSLADADSLQHAAVAPGLLQASGSKHNDTLATSLAPVCTSMDQQPTGQLPAACSGSTGGAAQAPAPVADGSFLEGEGDLSSSAPAFSQGSAGSISVTAEAQYTAAVSSSTDSSKHHPGGSKQWRQAQRARAAAVLIATKRQRALERAQEADGEAQRMQRMGWVDAEAAARKVAQKWRNRAVRAARVCSKAIEQAERLEAAVQQQQGPEPCTPASLISPTVDDVLVAKATAAAAAAAATPVTVMAVSMAPQLQGCPGSRGCQGVLSGATASSTGAASSGGSAAARGRSGHIASFSPPAACSPEANGWVQQGEGESPGQPGSAARWQASITQESPFAALGRLPGSPHSSGPSAHGSPSPSPPSQQRLQQQQQEQQRLGSQGLEGHVTRTFSSAFPGVVCEVCHVDGPPTSDPVAAELEAAAVAAAAAAVALESSQSGMGRSLPSISGSRPRLQRTSSPRWQPGLDYLEDSVASMSSAGESEDDDGQDTAVGEVEGGSPGQAAQQGPTSAGAMQGGSLGQAMQRGPPLPAAALAAATAQEAGAVQGALLGQSAQQGTPLPAPAPAAAAAQQWEQQEHQEDQLEQPLPCMASLVDEQDQATSQDGTSMVQQFMPPAVPSRAVAWTASASLRQELPTRSLSNVVPPQQRMPPMPATAASPAKWSELSAIKTPALRRAFLESLQVCSGRRHSYEEDMMTAIRGDPAEGPGEGADGELGTATAAALRRLQQQLARSNNTGTSRPALGAPSLPLSATSKRCTLDLGPDLTATGAATQHSTAASAIYPFPGKAGLTAAVLPSGALHLQQPAAARQRDFQPGPHWPGPAVSQPQTTAPSWAGASARSRQHAAPYAGAAAAGACGMGGMGAGSLLAAPGAWGQQESSGTSGSRPWVELSAVGRSPEVTAPASAAVPAVPPPAALGSPMLDRHFNNLQAQIDRLESQLTRSVRRGKAAALDQLNQRSEDGTATWLHGFSDGSRASGDGGPWMLGFARERFGSC